MNTQKILLVNDLAGYGKVALSVMIPVLSHLKCQTFNLPTALVSNTLDYGKFDILDTTDYMRNTIKVWEELNFSFDAVCTGIIVSEQQSRLVFDFCKTQKERGATIIVDPIMADNGKLYNGMTETTISYMRNMCAISDIIIPNLTEACLLAGLPADKSMYSRYDIIAILKELEYMGAKTIIITSANIDGNKCTILKEEGADYNAFTVIPFTKIPVFFPGTGDIFTSIVTAKYMSGVSLIESVTHAMSSIERLIMKNQHNVDNYKGIPIEQYLDEIY